MCLSQLKLFKFKVIYGLLGLLKSVKQFLEPVNLELVSIQLDRFQPVVLADPLHDDLQGG